MALQVTGSFKLKNGTFAVNPRIELNSNISQQGILTINALVLIPNGNGLPFVDNILYTDVDLSGFPSSETDILLAILDSTHKYVKSDLEVKHPTCTFNIV